MWFMLCEPASWDLFIPQVLYAWVAFTFWLLWLKPSRVGFCVDCSHFS